MTPLRILLADDHALVRAGFSSLIEKLGYKVVGEANDGEEVLRLLPALQPDIVLMDIAMPGSNGLETTVSIRREHPAVRVIILSMHATVVYARRAVRVGAAGYLLKDASAAELDTAIQAVARGETYLSSRIARFIEPDNPSGAPRSGAPLDRLTPRQREILQWIAEGHSRKEIAAMLHISVKTFDSHRSQIMERLDIHSAAELVRFASRTGLLSNET